MRKLVLLFLGVVFLAVQAMAQRTVTGTVTDDKENPLPNVSILVKGTTTGTTSRVNGTYTLVVPANAKSLIFSAVDMITMEIAISAQNSLDVKLKAEDKSLSEVVVVGYGTQRKKEVTGSMASVKGSAIAEKPVQSFESGLAGQAAGVQVTNSNGIVNNPPVFRIRGTNSISLSSYPLIVIDGVPTLTGDQGATSAPANALASINPNDIESIDIAKDAASTAIYGSRASNGVVFVTTKKGRAGKSRVNYDAWVGWVKPMRLPELLNAQQYTDFKNVALANAVANNPAQGGLFAMSTDNNGNPINTNWYDYVYRTGFSHSHDVSLSGGNDATTYYLSGGYTSQEGILQKNDFVRKNILLNVDSRVTKLISIGGKLAYSNELNLIGGSSGSLPGEAFATAGQARLALVQAPNVSPFLNNGAYNLGSASIIGAGNNYYIANVASGARSNPLTFPNGKTLLDLNRSNNEINHMQSNFYITVRPFKGVTLKTLYGVDNLLIDNDIFYTPLHGDGAGTSLGPGGNATASYAKNKTYVWTNTAQFDYTIASKHTIGLLVGNEQTRRTTNGFGIGRRTLSDSAYTVVQAGFTTNNTSGLALGENYLLSTFARLTYDYKKKYFLSGSLRQDDYSALGVKRGKFPGISAGWNIDKENVWASSHLDHVFSSFKIRASYGKTGNINGVGNFGALSTYGSGLYNGSPTLVFSSAGNPSVTWETSTKTDAGFSFGLFKDRVTAEVAFYKNDINGLLLGVPQSPSTGLPNSISQNVGKMYNKGVELTLNATPFASKDFQWTSSFNFTHNENKVTDLATGLTEILSSIGGGGTETVSKTLPGHSIGYLWVVRSGGVDPTSGRRIFYNSAGTPVMYENGVLPTGRFTWTNMDGTKYVNPKSATNAAINQTDDAVLYGNTQPKVYGGWSNTFRYKDFDVNFLFTYEAGFYIYYGTYAGLRDMRAWNNSTDVLNYWTKPGQVVDIPKPVYGDNVSNGSGLPSSGNVFKGDFIKLRTLQVGYNIPKTILGKAKISSARFYISGQNLAVSTKYPGPDPEVSTDSNANQTQGIDRNGLANGRTITLGININF